MRIFGLLLSLVSIFPLQIASFFDDEYEIVPTESHMQDVACRQRLGLMQSSERKYEQRSAPVKVYTPHELGAMLAGRSRSDCLRACAYIQEQIDTRNLTPEMRLLAAQHADLLHIPQEARMHMVSDLLTVPEVQLKALRFAEKTVAESSCDAGCSCIAGAALSGLFCCTGNPFIGLSMLLPTAYCMHDPQAQLLQEKIETTKAALRKKKTD
jgi:hypothetical protein